MPDQRQEADLWSSWCQSVGLCRSPGSQELLYHGGWVVKNGTIIEEIVERSATFRF